MPLANADCAGAALEVGDPLLEDGDRGFMMRSTCCPYSCRLKYAAADSGSSNT
jgi:hypothetical protein